jgi:hypothetical protein
MWAPEGALKEEGLDGFKVLKNNQNRPFITRRRIYALWRARRGVFEESCHLCWKAVGLEILGEKRTMKKSCQKGGTS